MTQDLQNLLIWWSSILLIGVAFLPLASVIFKPFFDKGYLFSKILGISLASYVLWALASFRWAPFVSQAILLILILFAVINLIILRRSSPRFSKRQYCIFIFEEVLFLACLLIWAFFRGHNPEIIGIEKFMDYGFLNSVLRSSYFPPQDMWYAGETINYYYFGHYIAAFLTKMTGIRSQITYNLMNATLFAFAFTLAFSLVSNLIYISRKASKKLVVVGGFVSALLLSLGGNLHTFAYTSLLQILKDIGVYHGQISSYWYPSATRYIGHNPDVADKTIHEFPSYSLVLGDMHAHLNDLIIVLLFLAVFVTFALKSRGSKEIYLGIENVIAGAILGIIFMTNSWDYPIYGAFSFLFLAFFTIGNKKMRYSVLEWLSVLSISIVLTLPFLFYLKNPTSGVFFAQNHSPLYQLFVLWGYQFILFAIFLAMVFFKKDQSNIVTGLWASLKLKITKISFTEKIFLLFFIYGFLLVLFPEVFYIKDICAEQFQRANTMFKFTFAASVFLTLASGYVVVRVFSLFGLWNNLLKVFVGVLVILPMIYPCYSLIQAFELNKTSYIGLDGSGYLSQGDKEAIVWLESHCSDNCRIVEAVGDSYTEYGRISSATGIPTIVGWPNHEWFWRGSSKGPYARRDEVSAVYTSKDQSEAERILKKYQIDYIVIGKLEREKFPDLKESFFGEREAVFESGETKIIKTEW